MEMTVIYVDALRVRCHLLCTRFINAWVGKYTTQVWVDVITCPRRYSDASKLIPVGKGGHKAWEHAIMTLLNKKACERFELYCGWNYVSVFVNKELCHCLRSVLNYNIVSVITWMDWWRLGPKLLFRIRICHTVNKMHVSATTVSVCSMLLTLKTGLS